ncbi:MAG TPA: hypothetical protein VLT60_08875 [Usitatibacter sp.]|nr:hypothetical protein [Usitatibacter sp.]
MVLKWLDTANSVAFGRELATFIMEELSHSLQKRDAKFTAKAEKVLARAARKVTDFKARERLNFYKKSKLANEFLWALKESGCPHDYTNELTRWLTVRLG